MKYLIKMNYTDRPSTYLYVWDNGMRRKAAFETDKDADEACRMLDMIITASNFRGGTYAANM